MGPGSCAPECRSCLGDRQPLKTINLISLWWFCPYPPGDVYKCKHAHTKSVCAYGAMTSCMCQSCHVKITVRPAGIRKARRRPRLRRGLGCGQMATGSLGEPSSGSGHGLPPRRSSGEFPLASAAWVGLCQSFGRTLCGLLVGPAPASARMSPVSGQGLSVCRNRYHYTR